MSHTEIEQPDDLSIAVSMAKSFVRKAFDGEAIENLGLEEVRPPDHGTVWQVTLGFDRSRPRRTTEAHPALIPNAFLQAAADAAARPQRVYKIVEVDTRIPKALSIVNWKED